MDLIYNVCGGWIYFEEERRCVWDCSDRIPLRVTYDFTIFCALFD